MSIKTAKGTELVIIKLKGKDYLPVQERVKWFREEHPAWGIKTSIVQMDEGFCLFRAEVFDETGRLIATGHKSETPQGFADNIEKSESGAIGRALALCGYGTQFAAELDEGTERVVDAPREHYQQQQQQSPTHKPLATPNADWPNCPQCNKRMIKSKFDKGPPYWCPTCKDNKKTSSSSKKKDDPTPSPPDYVTDELPF